jgi:hypothetical protein
MSAPVVSPVVFEATGPNESVPAEPPDEDPHLRSTRSAEGCDIAALDGAIGHVEDYITDDESWILRFIVVDTRNWLPGRKVLITPHWIRSVEWGQARVIVDLSREAIKGSPEFDPAQPVSVDYGGKLHDYYGRPRR